MPSWPWQVLQRVLITSIILLAAILRYLYALYCTYLRPFPLDNSITGDASLCTSRSGNLSTLCDGSSFARNEHLSCIRDGQLHSLEEAVSLAKAENVLLVVFVHCEYNPRSQGLLREIILANTGDIQGFLNRSVVFYLVSTFSPETASLVGLQGLAYPTVVVYSVKHHQHEGTTSLCAPPTKRGKGHRHHYQWWGTQFVASIEGVSTVTDLRTFLDTCEIKYPAW